MGSATGGGATVYRSLSIGMKNSKIGSLTTYKIGDRCENLCIRWMRETCAWKPGRYCSKECIPKRKPIKLTNSIQQYPWPDYTSLLSEEDKKEFFEGHSHKYEDPLQLALIRALDRLSEKLKWTSTKRSKTGYRARLRRELNAIDDGDQLGEPM